MRTLRHSRFDLPMATRHSEVKAIEDCPLGYVLKLLYEDRLADATFFALGEVVHDTIARATTGNWTRNQAVAYLSTQVDAFMREVDTSNLIETAARTLASMEADGIRMIESWFDHVHPDGANRLPILSGYAWPPRVEVTLARGTAWGTLDAVFEGDGLPPLIIDYKGSARKHRDADRDLQLGVYTYLWGEPARAAYVYLDRKHLGAMVDEASPYAGDEAIEARIAQTQATKERILDERRGRGIAGRHCGTCVAKTVCPVSTGRFADLAALTRDIKQLRAVPVPVNLRLQAIH